MPDIKSTKETLNQMIGGSWISQAIYVAAELGIADLLKDGPRTAEELADETDSSSEALSRLLRALSSVGIFAINSDQRFCLTPLAENLRTDIPGSQRAFAIMMGSEIYQAWGNLLHSVRTGEQAFKNRFGSPLFEYLTENPERGRIFDTAMTGIHGGETLPMIEAYDFSRFNTVVDIGGGNGLVLAEILKNNPSLKGVLFDLPIVAERARHNIEAEGLADRFQIVSGDFFKSVVPGGDAYIMRHIIHDWDDEKAIKILSNCRKTMNPRGKILVVETVIPDGNEPNFGKWLDLMMLVIGGKERTESQYRDLFDKAGLELKQIIKTSVEISLIEGISRA